MSTTLTRSAEQTLEQKTIGKGMRISLIRAVLDDETASALGRPIGSHEVYIRLEFPERKSGYVEGNTYPTASWYISMEDFRKLYNAIRKEKHFDRVREVLHGIRDEGAAKKEIPRLLHRLYEG
jgi:hypothetical protein